MSYKTYGSLARNNEIIDDNTPDNIFTINCEEDKENIIAQSAQSGRVLVIDIYGDFCAPCKLIKPKFKEFSMKYPQMIFATEDIKLELSDVEAVPFFQIWGYGKLIETLKGGFMDQLEQIIQKYLPPPRQGQSTGRIPPPMRSSYKK